jgi:Holliday junction resolvase RusA-like endonuclease
MSLITAELEALEVIIRVGLDTYIQVGQALIVIRDKHLYRQRGYASFGDYVIAYWRMTRQSAYLQMSSSVVALNLEDESITLTQAQALKALPEAHQQAVWTVLKESNPERKVTVREIKALARMVQDVVTTGTVSNGDDEQIAEFTVRDVVSGYLREVEESKLRQNSHIQAKSVKVEATVIHQKGQQVVLQLADGQTLPKFVKLFYKESNNE